MMKLQLAALAAIVIALASGISACGGGGGEAGSLEAYFGDLEKLAVTWNDAHEELDKASGEEFTNAASEDEQIAILFDFVRDERGLLDDFVTGITALDPPGEVESEHNAAVSSGEALLGMYDNVLTVLETVGTFDEGTAALDSPGFTEAAMAFGDACRDLSAVAADNEIEVDLRCR